MMVVMKATIVYRT